MNDLNDVTYAQACVEVLEVLKHMKKNDVDKLPKSKIQLYEENKDKNYIFKLNKNLKYEDQKISKKAKAILANLYINYWIDEKKRMEIKKEDLCYLNKIEEEKKKIFEEKNKNSINYINNNQEKNEEVAIIKYEKISFWKKIKNIFSKKFK